MHRALLGLAALTSSLGIVAAAATPHTVDGTDTNTAIEARIVDPGDAPEGVQVDAPVAPPAASPEELDALPVYDGYEADWQQQHDAMIVRVVDDFNADMGWDAGHPDRLDPALVKAWALQESGGHAEIFTSGDMMQMNNGGDWAPEKVHVGVEKGERLNPEESLRTALKWAYQKGEETRRGTPDGEWTVAIRDGEPVDGYVSHFTDWERAITRYNGGGVADYYGDITRRMSATA